LIARETGWTFEQIGNLTTFQLAHIQKLLEVDSRVQAWHDRNTRRREPWPVPNDLYERMLKKVYG